MNAKDVLHYGHQTLLSALEGISDQDAETGFVTDKWNVRDVVGHLSAFEHVLENVISTQLASAKEDVPYLKRFRDMSGEEFNQFYYEEYKFTPYHEVLANLNSSHDHIMSIFYLLTEDMLKTTGTLPWYGKQYSLEDFMIYNNYGHKREHASQIKRFKKHLNELKQQPSKAS
jgi:hypothetical protein